MRVRRQRGQAAIIGAIFFFVFAMAVFGALAALVAAQYSMTRQATAAQLLVGGKAEESLSVSISSGTVTVRNNGPNTAVITYYIGINSLGQQIVATNPQPAVAPQGTIKFSVSSSYTSVGVITSYGNMWWS
jgi:hypothetical protein